MSIGKRQRLVLRRSQRSRYSVTPGHRGDRLKIISIGKGIDIWYLIFLRGKYLV